MIEHQIQTTFEQPPDQVFDFLTDFRNEPRWNPDCRSVEKTSDGPIAVGTTFSSLVKGMGRVEGEILALDRAELCSVQNRARGMSARCDFRFTPTDSGTALTLAVEAQPRGPMRLLEPLMGRMIKRMFDELPERMRRGIGSHVPDQQAIAK